MIHLKIYDEFVKVLLLISNLSLIKYHQYQLIFMYEVNFYRIHLIIFLNKFLKKNFL